MLGLFYGLLFAVQLVHLIRAWRRKQPGKFLLAGNILSVLLSCFLLWYYDTLPGVGIMPGFAYFPEVFSSFCAAVCFGCPTLVTLLYRIFRKK